MCQRETKNQGNLSNKGMILTKNKTIQNKMGVNSKI